MNRKGYTLIEVMLAVSLSLMILFAVHLIPARIVESFAGYSREVTINQTSQTISSAVQTDLAQSYYIVPKPDGFEIGEVTYTFDSTGVIRHIAGKTQQLTELELTFSVDDDLLTVSSADENTYHAQVDLVFPFVYTTFDREANADG